MIRTDQITMETLHSMESYILLNTRYDINGYDSSAEKQFYENHSLDLWSTCKCKDNKPLQLLTPPTSPRHDPFTDSPVNSSDILCDALDCLDDETLTQTLHDVETSEDLSTSLDMFESCLIQDCMWSGPGLALAGFGVVQPITRRLNSVDENCNSLLLDSKKSQNDLTNCCVDPAVVFPHVSRTPTPTPPNTHLSLNVPSISSDWSTSIDTPSASESDEEIDVVGDEKLSASYRLTASALSSTSSKNRPTIRVINSSQSSMLSKNLPATTSMSAQVAAMHNYSSTPSIKSQSCLRNSLSAPQTPSVGHHQLKRSRPFCSSPPSPQVYKKQRLGYDKHRSSINTERDLHSVVRKLTSVGRKPKCNNDAYSRSSSDNEDMTENGKRAYHNVLERKRRDDLRLSFHLLRCAVPEIRDNERSPKMVILNQTAEYVLYLGRQELKLEAEHKRQKLINEQLRRKLADMQEDMY